MYLSAIHLAIGLSVTAMAYTPVWRAGRRTAVWTTLHDIGVNNEWYLISTRQRAKDRLNNPKPYALTLGAGPPSPFT